jgi:hypothetical protein
MDLKWRQNYPQGLRRCIREKVTLIPVPVRSTLHLRRPVVA